MALIANIKQLLRMMVKALESHSDMDLIEAIVICLTRLLPLLPSKSPIHKFMFWIAISILQLEDASLYVAGTKFLKYLFEYLFNMQVLIV